jgi:class 3 adenylate cyclase
VTLGDSALLVVDDNEDNRFTLIQRLRREGYTRVSEADDGHNALEMLAAQPFDLVLLDVMMPGMNGFQVLERMRADMALRLVPVIMISAIDEIESVVRCIELGAEDYLPKPFNPILLRARVGACLEKKRLRDQEVAYLNRLEEEQRRGDALLKALLPPGALRELKATGGVEPRRYDDVAVLFCDVVDFTRYCDQNPPEQVVAELHALFAQFEELVDQCGLEKIKTVGDAFLATAGLLHATDTPVLASVRCGLAMIEATAALNPHWQVRVGIHHGPVVAGIIGSRQYLFDVWGDTVNTAARIVTQAEPGKVVTSSAAWMHVRSHCHGRSYGLVDLKGKGELELIECAGLHST